MILAAHDDKGSLRCIGCVATGFGMAARGALRGAFNELDRYTSVLGTPAPAAVDRSARWVDAVLIADIENRELSAAGIIRHPSFRGIRSDRAITEVGWPK
ncbi:hypothetical protein IU487_33820 [Nocardia puris]|nr:hypothetical protein [Nocardia puris]